MSAAGTPAAVAPLPELEPIDLYTKNRNTNPSTIPSCILALPCPDLTERAKRVEVLPSWALNESNELAYRTQKNRGKHSFLSNMASQSEAYCAVEE